MVRSLLYWVTLSVLLTSSLSWAEGQRNNGATDWQVVYTPAQLLSCTYYFYRFSQAIEFVDRVADIAEAENYYPDLYIYDRHNVRVDLYTPSSYKLTEYDAYMAEVIDNVFLREFAY